MIYTRIRNIREDNDLTQREMAEYLNVAQRSYSRYENGDREMPVETLMKIADGFGTSVDYLLERTDEKRPYRYAEKYKEKLKNIYKSGGIYIVNYTFRRFFTSC